MYFCIAIRYFSVRKGKMGGRRKGKDPNHGNSTMVKMRRFMVQVRKYDFIYPCESASDSSLYPEQNSDKDYIPERNRSRYNAVFLDKETRTFKI